jgi:hypothetical protein
VSKPWKPNKKTVELKPVAQPSRIRREPLPEQQRGLASIDWTSREWEIRFAVAGVIFFALAISAVVIDIGVVVGF